MVRTVSESHRHGCCKAHLSNFLSSNGKYGPFWLDFSILTSPLCTSFKGELYGGIRKELQRLERCQKAIVMVVIELTFSIFTVRIVSFSACETVLNRVTGKSEIPFLAVLNHRGLRARATRRE